jgi:flagellin
VDPTGLGEYLVGTDQLKNSNSTFFPAGFPSVASSKSGLTSKIAEAEDITIYGNVGNATIDINGGATAKEIAAAITARKGETGVYADAQTRMNITFSELDAGSNPAPDTVSFNLYGKNDTAVLIAANVDFGIVSGAGADLSELAAAVNGTSGKTGITASLSIDKSTMTLISDDGYDIVVEDYNLVAGTGPSMNVSGADENLGNLTDGSTNFTTSDSSTVSYYSPIELTAGNDPDTVGVSGTIKFHSPFVFSVATDSQGTDEAPTFTVDQSAVASSTTPQLTANNTTLLVVPETTGTSVTGNSGSPSGMTIEFRTDSSGNIMTPVRILNMGSGFEYGDVLNINESLLGGDANGTVTVTIDATTAKPDGTDVTVPGGLFSGNPSGASLSSVSDLDVLTVAKSLKMLTAVDGALVRIDLERSDLGATMSRMEHTISNLSNIVMNTKAARSRIADADIALESTELSKAQVLNQAAQAMLAQANKAQQSILQLLN